MSISKNIKRLREIYGLSQQDLADITGVTNRAVSSWENGKIPRMPIIEIIATKFELQKWNLIEENGMENLHLNGTKTDVSTDIMIKFAGLSKEAQKLVLLELIKLMK